MIPGALGAELLCAAGIDWLCIDVQHGLIDEAEMRVMVQAAGTRDTPVLVRPVWNEPSAIMRALDAGAVGAVAGGAVVDLDPCSAEPMASAEPGTPRTAAATTVAATTRLRDTEALLLSRLSREPCGCLVYRGEGTKGAITLG